MFGCVAGVIVRNIPKTDDSGGTTQQHATRKTTETTQHKRTLSHPMPRPVCDQLQNLENIVFLGDVGQCA